MKQNLQNLIQQTINNLYNINIDSAKIRIETPKSKNFGDFSTTISMILAPQLKDKPENIAQNLINQFINEPMFKKVEIAGKGFINFFLEESIWVKMLNSLSNDPDFFKNNIGKDKNVLIEFVSANPTGPLHIGHGRGAVLGDVLGNLLKINGYNVTKEYYTNDAGNQMRILGDSIYLRLKELKGEKIDFPQDYYQGDYITKIAKKLLQSPADIINKDIDYFTEEGVASILPEIKDDLKDFGVVFDTWFSEKTLFTSGKVENIIKQMKSDGGLYFKENAWWLKVEGDEDRVVIKSDGSYTYLASDIAYHKNKFERGFDILVDIWGADHHGYIPRIRAAIKKCGEDPDKLKIMLVQMVTLLRNREKIPMSTRKGKFVTLKEVVDEVGKDASRFIFMTRRHDAQLEFDLELAKEKSNDNPVYYVQYAHARICSILKNSEIPIPQKIDKISCPDDIDIIKLLLEFKDTLITASENLEPHLVTYYLIQLASNFHSYYNRNKILGNSERLFLIEAIKKVLKQGLDILGVSAPETM